MMSGTVARPPRRPGSGSALERGVAGPNPPNATVVKIPQKKTKQPYFRGFSLGKGGANLDSGTKTEEGKVFGLIFFVQVAKLNWGQELRGSCDGGSCGKNMPQEFLTPGHPVIPPEVFSVFEYVWFLGGPNTTPPQEVVFGCLG